MAPKDDELRPVMTRLPERLRRKLDRAASANKRSMNAEIIHRLEVSFGGEGGLVGAAAELLSELRDLRVKLSLWGAQQADSPSKEDKS